MQRREFIAGLGSAAAWPVVARAQQPSQMRRIGVLMNLAADDPETVRRMTAFKQALQELGWTDGRNVRFDYRSALADADRQRRNAAELVALVPDVLLANGAANLGALQHVTRTLPIVFVNTNDPVGGGYVASLSRPGGNATGFMSLEYSLSGTRPKLVTAIG
jgi:putative ABC transport system substrate-binding protein